MNDELEKAIQERIIELERTYEDAKEELTRAERASDPWNFRVSTSGAGGEQVIDDMDRYHRTGQEFIDAQHRKDTVSNRCSSIERKLRKTKEDFEKGGDLVIQRSDGIEAVSCGILLGYRNQPKNVVWAVNVLCEESDLRNYRFEEVHEDSIEKIIMYPIPNCDFILTSFPKVITNGEFRHFHVTSAEGDNKDSVHEYKIYKYDGKQLLQVCHQNIDRYLYRMLRFLEINEIGYLEELCHEHLFPECRIDIPRE